MMLSARGFYPAVLNEDDGCVTSWTPALLIWDIFVAQVAEVPILLNTVSATELRDKH